MGNELFLDFVAVLGFGAPFVYLLDYELRKNGHEITPISNRAVYWRIRRYYSFLEKILIVSLYM